ncbi:protein-L-isoaspartate(D-aspartate) O-methyltransferase [Imperialibacter roseus]|uniref:Protein-L-isoaspartate O-methyltransferase n=1 Tax=Imperialibacter roseus TaxID=1324217 RepID=A0ABZ0ITW7_9BACT|nr:protein-L-isoaspartate(D-aspartate) O-methyltransferase [Imperialibacter roseus]WOK08477.1 protein-L-isoaspartate(D-aspartate) O-methyltransferase [Imperialibacter roseus]
MEDSYRHKGLRRGLVNTLIEKGIKSKMVLDAIGKVPRHFFFDNAFVEHAYQDKAFPIGEDQTISQPYTVAFQTQLTGAGSGSKVLEIGTGSGYQCCILLELGAEVYTIEYNKVLYERTRKFLPSMGYKAYFFQGDGSKGMPNFAPFDAILVTAGAPTIPTALVEQLKPGGRLVIPVGDDKSQKMIRITKKEGNKLVKETFDNFSFVPLLGEHGWGKK